MAGVSAAVDVECLAGDEAGGLEVEDRWVPLARPVHCAFNFDQAYRRASRECRAAAVVVVEADRLGRAELNRKRWTTRAISARPRTAG